MKFEDMKDWRIDQLKKEVVRLSKECEKMYHENLDLKEALDRTKRHQSDCITINQLYTTIDVIVDRYANLRKIHGVS